jgi:hypothetical protein
LVLSSTQSFPKEGQVESASEDEQVIIPVRASASAPEPAGPMALACRIPQAALPAGSGPLAPQLALSAPLLPFMGPVSYASTHSLLDSMEEGE